MLLTQLIPTLGYDISTATTNTSSVVQFSSNPQVNEGYVHDILSDDNLADGVKEAFIKDYLGKQASPEIQPVSLKSSLGASTAGDDPSIHKAEIPKHKNLLEMLSLHSWIDNLLVRAADWFVLSKARTNHHLAS